jgi:hypothetical protein
LAQFEHHIVFPATVFTYSDARPPWFVLPPVRGSYTTCAARLDDTRCLIVGSQNDIAIVDVLRQSTLETTCFPGDNCRFPKVALSKDRNIAVLYHGNLCAVVVIRIDPLNVTVLDRVSRTETEHRFLSSVVAPGMGQRLHGGFSWAAFNSDDHIVAPSIGAMMVLNIDTGDVTTRTFDGHHAPPGGWLSPTGRWAVAVRQFCIDYAPAPGPDDVARPSHPDLLADHKPRWGLQLALWDLTNCRLERIFTARFYEERELLHGWVRDFAQGDADVMWRFADWFGLKPALSPAQIEQLGADPARAYNEARAKKYSEARAAVEARHCDYIRRLTFLGKVNAQSRQELDALTLSAARDSNFKTQFALNDTECRDFFGRIIDIAWLEDEASFVALFDDGLVRQIDVGGAVVSSVRLERFRQEAWQKLGPARGSAPGRSTPRSRLVSVDGRRVRVFGTHGGSHSSYLLNPYGYVEFDLPIAGGIELLDEQKDNFVETTFADLRAQITEAADAANQYRVALTDLSEPACIRAIEQLTADVKEKFEAVLLLGYYEPFFKLPDRVMGEEEFFKHVTSTCPHGGPALRNLIAAVVSRWVSARKSRRQVLLKDDSTEALAYAVTALAALDPGSFTVVKRYLDSIDYGHTLYFKSQFFEDLAPCGRWQDPNWLPLAFRHLAGDFCETHWATMGFRQAVMQLPDARAFLGPFCSEFESEIRPDVEASAKEYPAYIAKRRQWRAEYTTKGEPIPLNYSVENDDEPVDVEAKVTQWIDENLGSFIKNNLSTHPIDIWLREQLVSLRPSVADQL